MPTTVNELFEHADVVRSGAVRWGTPVALQKPGVYVIATSQHPDQRDGLLDGPFDERALEQLIRARPEIMIDNAAADATRLNLRLRAMWPAGESVVYIGNAGADTGHRVKQFYDTRIGARAPHAGGWPVKMLETGHLWVHYGAAARPEDAERAMIALFADAVPTDVRCALVDPSAPLPYANLEFPAGGRKVHGIRGAKELRKISRSPALSGSGPTLAYAASFGRHAPKKDYGTCPDCFTTFTAAGICSCLR